VLFVRVTPKMAESFWTKVARGAAMTQGMALPPIKRLKSGFERLQAFCGRTEVTPIHPFKLELRVSETDTIYEGLYAFDPAALGPGCSTVTLVLYSEKEPAKADTRSSIPRSFSRSGGTSISAVCRGDACVALTISVTSASNNR
jgi:hypothetical protein